MFNPVRWLIMRWAYWGQRRKRRERARVEAGAVDWFLQDTTGDNFYVQHRACRDDGWNDHMWGDEPICIFYTRADAEANCDDMRRAQPDLEWRVSDKQAGEGDDE